MAERSPATAERRDACVTPVCGNHQRLHNRRRRGRSAAWQPPKALCSAKRAGVLACETLGGGNHQRLHNRRRRDACVLCFAERLRRWLAFAVGATVAEITTAYTTTQARTPAVSALQSAFGDGHASAAGGDCGRNYYRLHNRRRRDARKGERSAAWQPPKALCSAKSAGVLACETPVCGNLFGCKKSLSPTQPTQARRLLSRLAPWGRLWQTITTACEKPGRANAAQPGNRRRRFAPQRAQASSPAKRQALVIFSATWRPRGRVNAAQPGEQASSPAKRSAVVIFSCASDYRRPHNRRRRDACYPGIRRGGDCGNDYRRLHNRRRRGRLLSRLAQRALRR